MAGMHVVSLANLLLTVEEGRHIGTLHMSLSGIGWNGSNRKESPEDSVLWTES